MARSKLIEKTFYCDLYEVQISYLFGGDVDSLKKFIRSRHGDARIYSGKEEYKLYEETVTDGLQFHVRTPNGEADRFYVWKAYATSSLLNHETWHLTIDIMTYIGARHSDDSEECYAYFNGWISKKILEQLNIKFKMPKQ